MDLNSRILSFWQNAEKLNDEFYFIAEIGNNHNGDIEVAKVLIDTAKSAGAHCVKFQMRDMDSLYRKSDHDEEDLGVEYTKDLIAKFNLTVEQHRLLRHYALSKNIDYLCTPWDEKSVATLEEFNVPAYKVASADFTNIPLLKELQNTGKPLILSTGMTSTNDFQEVMHFLNDSQSPIALLHCNSTYPAPFADINLRQLENLKNYCPIVGYSGHERGIAITLAAYTMGARIIERHVTMDRSMEGPDHAASLEPQELHALIAGLNEIKAGLGSSGDRVVSQGEMMNRENLSKSLVSTRNIIVGEEIAETDITVVSPGRGLSPLKYSLLVGTTAQRSIKVGSFFEESDLGEPPIQLKNDFQILGNWGIPVRYHDYLHFSTLLNAKMWEFHLSYKDLEIDASTLQFSQSEAELIVHAPELFADSHLLDLTSPDSNYRSLSITNMKKVIEQTKMLGKYFNSDGPIKIVTNVGGFSMDAPLGEYQRLQRYEILSESLSLINDFEVDIIPQTMAPFPWHFGGQRFQNIFLDAVEIVEWCNKLNLRICLDTSHSKLYCNYKGLDFNAFVEALLPLTTHIHLGDAKYTNGEGLQIGDGDINFEQLFSLLKELDFQHSILPEIWQGHKNNGSGFALALMKMEELS